MQSGETLGQIAHNYGRSETQLARVNGFDSPQSLKKGQHLFIPDATTLQRTEVTVQVRSSLQPSVDSNAKQRTSKINMSLAKDINGTRFNKLVGKEKRPETIPGQFAWPLRGTVLRHFGDQNPFPCKGIEIAAPKGSPVLAAAAGRVIYSGDGISSFGNMIILRHDGDFYTVYAFTQKNIVKNGNFVSKGEQIALSGEPAQGRSPRLYFELRYHKEPINPTFYLP